MVMSAKPRRAKNAGQTALMSPPWSSPSPRRNHACGVNKLSVSSNPPTCEIGEERPAEEGEHQRDDRLHVARRVRCLRERGHQRQDAHRGEHRTEHEQGHTEGVAPVRAEQRVVATTSTVILMMPRAKEVSALPRMIDPRLMGAASSRSIVPSRRSSSSPLTPNDTVKNRKKTAMPAAR